MNSPSPTSSTKPHLVLCIDDADIALRVRELLLSGEGYNVLLECDSTDLEAHRRSGAGYEESRCPDNRLQML